MKRILLLALTVAVSASLFTAHADNKKRKKNKKVQQVVEKPVSLVTASDSVSYAAGMAMTNGLLPFLKNQYGVDEVFIDQFVEGFQKAMNEGVGDPIKAYSAGMQIAAMVNDRMIPGEKAKLAGTPDSLQTDLFVKGFIASLKKDTTLFKNADAELLYEKRQAAAQEAKNERNKKEGEQFLAENKTKEGVITTPSGLQYKILTEGTGEVAGKNDNVTVKYEGRLLDGTVFDSSYERTPDTMTFSPNHVIKGWTEALTMMPAGSKWQLFIPQELAYGARQTGDKIAPYSTLIFTVEVISVEKQAQEKQ